MDINTLRDVLLSYMTRDDLRSSGGVDIPLVAINNAKRFLQRKYNFFYAYFQLQLPNVDLVNGATLDPGVQWFNVNNPTNSAPGTLLDVSGFKCGSLKRVWLPLIGINQPFFPIEVISRETSVKALQRRIESNFGCLENSSHVGFNYAWARRYFSAVRMGNLIYIEPANLHWLNQTYTMGMDSYVWFPDYDQTVWKKDFFLDYCADLLQYRAMEELNFFLKEDQRIPISQKKMESLWLDVMSWDAGLSNNATDSDATLD
jgi:hypothetical protein